MSALTKYEESLASCPARGAGLHQHIMRVACLGVLAEIPPPDIVRDLHQIPKIKPNEAEDAVRKASNTTFQSAPMPVKREKRKKTIDDFIGDTPQDEMELLESSQTKLGAFKNDGRLLLETLYAPDEYLFIGGVYDCKVQQVKHWMDKHDFPHIIPNPMTGEYGETGTGKESRRCDATVADLRYAVCEMDSVPYGKQVAFWLECIRLGLPVAAVIHSGNKSLHGWLKVNCGIDSDKWDNLVRDWWFKDFGAHYGLDPACQNKARLSRMPGHERKQGMQKLLYLNGAV